MARVNSFCRFNWTIVYSSVIFVLAWPAILLASMLLPPTSCRHVMLARRREWGPKPRKSQPSAVAALFSACRTPESHIGSFRLSACVSRLAEIREQIDAYIRLGAELGQGGDSRQQSRSSFQMRR